MVIGIRQLEWLNHNSQRAYPLTADSTRKDNGATPVFEIPDDFIVAMYLPVDWSMDIEVHKFYVSSISAYGSGFQVEVSYDGTVKAKALIPRTGHTENTTYTLSGVDDLNGIRGHITIGSLDNIDTQPSGTFNFDLEDARLEPDVIRPNIRGVASVQVQNGDEVSRKLYGNVRLRAGRNTRLWVEDEEGSDPVIVFDAIEGEGLNEDCYCEADANPIKTINGISPDEQGNFVFLGGNCVDVAEGDHAVTFVDQCSEPCCGCKELEAVTEALEAFGDKAATLENFLVNLEARVTQMDQTILGARLGDRGCDNC